MTQTAIPVEFESYLQNKINAGSAPDMNQMIFAYIPDLDIDTSIDRELGLPDAGLWVHEQDVDQSGKLGDDALVYSVVIPSDVEAFTFNAIYLHDKNVADSCGMIVFKADETKEGGMAITKSLVQQYSGAAVLSGITVDAETWQIDYQARLFGIEEDHRLTCLDSYGHTAFIDGFDVTQEADPTKYKITAGLAYIGGLRATLDAENIQTIVNNPNGIYLDVHREGTALSQWDNVLTITLSETAVTDYIDAQGKQHYVAKLATINADGSISDQRIEQTGELERADNAATDADIDAESTAEKHINLPQLWRAINKKIDDLTAQIEKERVSVGEIIEITGVSTNPATLKGYGTWQSFGAGLVTVGVGSHTDSRGENKSWTDGQIEGEYKHVQTESELATHSIDFSGETDDNTSATNINVFQNTQTGDTGTATTFANAGKTDIDLTHKHTFSGKTDSIGDSSPMNNTQPTVAVYRWKRTA